MSKTNFLKETLEAIAKAHRTRALRPVTPLSGMNVQVEDREAINFCSNDYLGLATDPRVVQAAIEAASEHGAGSGAARLITGTRNLHLELERAIADLLGTESALLFGAGYLAAVGTIDALVGKEDAIFSDSLNHACLIDGCRLSGAKVNVYPHCDAEALENLLGKTAARRKLVVTESIFSMDGDAAPLAAISQCCKRHDALLMVDEAHAIGVAGSQGQGLVSSLGLASEVDVVMGTLGKSLGSFGAFVAGSGELTRYLLNKARTFIFQTALPPANVAAAMMAIKIMQGEESPVSRLQKNILAIGELLKGLLGDSSKSPDGKSPSAIFPIILGGEEKAMAASAALLAKGYLVQGIRPPTVPPGTSRLRITVSATHEPEDIQGLSKAIADIL